MKKLLFMLFTAILLASCNQPTQVEDETIEQTPTVVEEKTTEEKTSEETEGVKETPKAEEKVEVKEEPKVEVKTKTEVPAATETVVQESTENNETVEQPEENSAEENSEETPSEDEPEETPVEDTWSEVILLEQNDDYGYAIRFAVPADYDPTNFVFGDDTDPSVDYNVLKFDYIKTVERKSNTVAMNDGVDISKPYQSVDIYKVSVNDKYEGEHLFIYYSDVYAYDKSCNIAFTIDRIDDAYYLHSAAYKNNICYSEKSGYVKKTITTINFYKN